MTVEFNIDDHNSMLIAIIAGDYEYEKVVKVTKMALEKCMEKDLKRALIDLAQTKNIDIPAIEKFVLGKELSSDWGTKVRLCVVYAHKFIPDIHEKAKEGPGGWALFTANKNQSVFWLLAK